MAALAVPAPAEYETAVRDGAELRRMADRYGVENLLLVLGAVAREQNPPKPLGPIRIPPLRDTRPSEIEVHLDKVIRKHARDRELDAGLEAILASGMDEWRKREITQIVAHTVAGLTAEQVGEVIGISVSTVERRLNEVRQAANEADEKKYGRALETTSLSG
ncbi:MAG TPA: hypothetical protein VJQ59_05925, partial [Candidatus Sulfotelmatobacter sp.]|nr:hypothetical protein [Candidatus Sulfotelmatobacter sp.]